MKYLLIILVLCSCKTKYHYSKDLTKADLKEMDSIYIEGLKAIRHDNLVRFHFKEARNLKKEIKEKTNKTK